MEIRDSEMSLVFFILYICKKKNIMKEKNQGKPPVKYVLQNRKN